MSKFLKDHFLFNELVKENLTKNMIEILLISSHFVAEWKCPYCKNIWNYEVRKRISKGAECRTCFGKTTLKNRFSVVFPKVAEEFHPTKNGDLTIDNLHGKSNIRVWWLGKECKHEWQTSVNNRTSLKHNCPYCCNQKLETGVNDITIVAPKYAEEWDYDLNEILPNQAFISTTRYWWKCTICEHSWNNSVSARLSHNNNCPKCAKVELAQTLRNHSINKFGSLLDERPDIAIEWDYEKNDLTPDLVSVESSHSVFWKCKKCNFKWKTSVSCRVLGQSNCRTCFGSKSFKEQEFIDFVRTCTNYEVLNNDREIIKPKELDVIIPELKIAIEFNGNYWHSDEKLLRNNGLTAEETHLIKVRLCEEADYSLFFVWEDDWDEKTDKVKKAVANLLGNNSVSPILNILSKG